MLVCVCLSLFDIFCFTFSVKTPHHFEAKTHSNIFLTIFFPHCLEKILWEMKKKTIQDPKPPNFL